MLHISLAAEKLWTLFGFLPITNSLLTTWLTMLILFLLAWLATRRMSLVPGTVQSIAESVVGGLYDVFHQVTGHHTKKFFPLLASIFLFVLLANWIGLLPGVGTVGFYHAKEEKTVEKSEAGSQGGEAAPVIPADDHGNAAGTVEEGSGVVPGIAESGPAKGASEKESSEGHGDEPAFTPLLRAATADLNMTIGLALIAVIAIQFFGFSLVGFHYSSRFFNFSNPIMFVLGILELVSEISKVISFAFRLFGNIFAGEVLLAVLAFLIPFVIPLPFLMMELFVGLIQALVFSMLTAVFLNVAVSHGEEHA